MTKQAILTARDNGVLYCDLLKQFNITAAQLDEVLFNSFMESAEWTRAEDKNTPEKPADFIKSLSEKIYKREQPEAAAPDGKKTLAQKISEYINPQQDKGKN